MCEGDKVGGPLFSVVFFAEFSFAGGLFQLSISGLVFAPCIGVFALSILNLQGAALNIKLLAKAVFEIAGIAVWQSVALGAVNNNSWRIGTTLMGVTGFGSPAVAQWWWIAPHQCLENIVELGGGEMAKGPFISFFNRDH